MIDPVFFWVFLLFGLPFALILFLIFLVLLLGYYSDEVYGSHQDFFDDEEDDD